MAKERPPFEKTLDPSNHEDSIVVGSFKKNSDGSITICCQIDVIDHSTGEAWGVDTKVLRLPKRR